MMLGGWVGTRLVGREPVVLGPGLSVHRGPGWGERSVGPDGMWSSRWEIGDSVLIVAPQWDVDDIDAVVERWRDEIIAANDPDAEFDPPMPIGHPGGEARVVSWTTLTMSGDPVIGRLTVVMEGATAVVLDARWPEDEESSVINEIRLTVDSLSVEPLTP